MKTKVFSIIGLILFMVAGINVFAQTPMPKDFRLDCITQQYPTTTFLIRVDGEFLRAQVLHHNGMQYAPIINGNYTARDLPILTEKANAIQKVKENMYFSWNLKKCKYFGNSLFQCLGSEGSQDSGGAKVSAYGITTSQVTAQTMGMTFNSFKVNLSMTIDGKDVDVSMPYYNIDDCTKF